MMIRIRLSRSRHPDLERGKGPVDRIHNTGSQSQLGLGRKHFFTFRKNENCQEFCHRFCGISSPFR
jgi:hypothetical protein